MTADQHVTHARAVDHVLRGTDGPHVVVGPMVWRPNDGTTTRSHYFIVATSGAGRGFRCDAIHGDAADRLRFLVELTRRRPIVIHDMGDELAMARLCKALWPGERTIAICRAVEAERGAA